MEKEQPLISIIVPMYNMESYIEKCLDSLLAQTYNHMEIIVVDDASKDGCGKICDGYAKKDKRIQVVHMPLNGGLSAARNEGVSRAAGKFAVFVDSDDYVEPRLLETLYQSLAESGADLSVCGGEGIRLKEGVARTYSREEAVLCLARRTPFLWMVWGKLYPMELVRKHPFDKDAFCCEDLLFFYQILNEVEKVSFVPDKLYHYVYREGSLINSGVDEKRCRVLSVLDAICSDAQVHFPEAEAGFHQVALDTNARLAMLTVETGRSNRQAMAYLKRFQTNIRRHFCFRAICISPAVKDSIAVLLLWASARMFWGMALLYCWIKRLRKGIRERIKENRRRME